jgi:hypothetical protein
VKKELTHSQLQAVYSQVDDIISTLDDSAISELFNGNLRDVDLILELLYEETANVIAFDSGKIKSGSFGYLDRFSSQVDESLKCFSLNYFIATALPDFIMNWHHIEWGNLVQTYKKLSIIASRDHGKSYFFSFAYIIWKMYRYQKSTAFRVVPKEYRLSKYGMLITNEFGLAKHLLALIKDEIESNDLLREKLYPGKEHKWAETEITCKIGSSLVIKSFGSKMRGFHPGYIVTDDFMNDSVLYSENQRNKYISLFHSVLMNALLSGGQAINVGTPYSTKDLFADLKLQSSWFSFEYPAIFPDGSLLWEGRHNLKSILEKKETQGSLIFSREILCRPISSESTIFPWEILQRSFLGMDEMTIVNNVWSHPNKFTRIAIGCDFSISASVGADYSVFIVLGVDEFGRYWLLHMYREKGKKYTEQIAVLKKLNTDFKPDVIFVETNQMQVIFAQGATDAGLPVVEHQTGVDKHDLRGGLPGLAILFENNKFRFPRGDQKSIDVTDTICLELSSVTWTDKGKLEGISEHDDCCMALWQARLAADYVNSNFNFAFI